MVENFNYKEKISKALTNYDAALCLKENKFYRQSTILLWQTIKDLLFAWLEKNKYEYSSTREAIVIALSSKDLNDYNSDIMLIYLVSTMSEWDESFQINKSQLLDFENKSIQLIRRFQTLLNNY